VFISFDTRIRSYRKACEKIVFKLPLESASVGAPFEQFARGTLKRTGDLQVLHTRTRTHISDVTRLCERITNNSSLNYSPPDVKTRTCKIWSQLLR